MTHFPVDAPQFFLTAPARCPYLPERMERKVFTHLVGDRAIVLNDALSQGGFRRSQNIAYRPACENCQACVSARIPVGAFSPNRTQRRTLSRNGDVVSRWLPPITTDEQFDLFHAYLMSRHADGGMIDMNQDDYASMVEDTQVRTQLAEYRIDNGGGQLIGVALTDTLVDGLSMVYSFYDPDDGRRSIGTLMILDHIARTRRAGLPYLYLGYWVNGSRKMDYKRRFRPLEILSADGWQRLDDDEAMD